MSSLELSVHGWRAVFLLKGASLIELWGPDGFNWIPTPPPSGRHLFGAVAGPWANRLDPAPWGLSANDGRLHLHGGFKGTDLREWRPVQEAADHFVFFLEWPEGDEGYPAMELSVTYRLSPGVLEWELSAQSSRPVPLNLVHHGYWNLGAPVIDGHQLQIAAPAMRSPGPEGMTMPPELGNPFRQQAPLQETWDHTFLLDTSVQDGVTPAAVLSYQNRQMVVATTCPSLHLYSGHFLPKPRSGVCLECGYPPGRWGERSPTDTFCQRTRHVFYSHSNQISV